MYLWTVFIVFMEALHDTDRVCKRMKKDSDFFSFFWKFLEDGLHKKNNNQLKKNP